LVSIARGLQGAGHDVEIIVFYRSGTQLESDAEAAGVTVTDLGKRGRWDAFGFLRQLRRRAAEQSLDVMYSFLPTSNVVATVLWGWASRPALVWGVRGSHAARASHDWLGQMLTHVERWLARWPAAVIVNSEAGRDERCAAGWPQDCLHVVHNGVDADDFAFDPSRRLDLRAEWLVSPSTRVVGFAGRLDPVKGLEIFLRAIREVTDVENDVRVVIAGTGTPSYTAALQALAIELGLTSRIHWLGQLTGMASFYSAIDLLCLPSFSEGCSNVIGESLACGTLVVATRSGDTGALIDDPLLLAYPGDVAGLVRALREGLKAAALADRTRLRATVLDRLSSERMVQATEKILSAAAGHRAKPA